jgi:hypothetical protein
VDGAAVPRLGFFNGTPFPSRSSRGSRRTNLRTLVLTAVVFGMKDNEVQVQIHQIPSHILFLPPRLASIANFS